MILFFCISYFCFGIISATFTQLFYAKSRRLLAQINEKHEAIDVTVIIPFRNEYLRISNLLQSINALGEKPKKILFIDDYSNDETVFLIKKTIATVDYEIIPAVAHGKKQAIHQAVHYATTEFCLTWDADIIVQPNYFQALKKHIKSDLYILPVAMEGTGLLGKFAELDFLSMQAMNWMCTGLSRPILASGANLLFRRSAYIQCNTMVQHSSIASGDDMFLLQDFILNNKKIEVLPIHDLKVITETPLSLISFLQQRLRWIKKTKDISDSFANTIGIVNVIFTFLWIFTEAILLVNQLFAAASLVFFTKYLVDSLMMFRVIIFQKRTKLFPYLFLIELLYPFYILFLLIGIFSIKLKWKGRTIEK
jgi:poly-beta-1,6-N-acetyl-D-glucosamine synthase